MTSPKGTAPVGASRRARRPCPRCTRHVASERHKCPHGVWCLPNFARRGVGQANACPQCPSNGLDRGLAVSDSEIAEVVAFAETYRPDRTVIAWAPGHEPAEDERSHAEGAIKLTLAMRCLLLWAAGIEHFPSVNDSVARDALVAAGLLRRNGETTAKGDRVARTIGAS